MRFLTRSVFPALLEALPARLQDGSPVLSAFITASLLCPHSDVALILLLLAEDARREALLLRQHGTPLSGNRSAACTSQLLLLSGPVISSRCLLCTKLAV